MAALRCTARRHVSVRRGAPLPGAELNETPVRCRAFIAGTEVDERKRLERKWDLMIKLPLTVLLTLLSSVGFVAAEADGAPATAMTAIFRPPTRSRPFRRPTSNWPRRRAAGDAIATPAGIANARPATTKGRRAGERLVIPHRRVGAGVVNQILIGAEARHAPSGV
jgi:hypothetical protein